MTTQRLPRRLRAAVVALVVLGLLVLGAGTAAIRYGAAALDVGRGGEASAPAAGGVWFGVELANRSALPVVLRSVRVAAGTDARIAEARVLDRRDRAAGVGVVADPLPAEVLEATEPLDGFVLPPGSGDRYQLVVLVEPLRPGGAAVVRATDVLGTVLGLDHGARSTTVLRIRAA